MATKRVRLVLVQQSTSGIAIKPIWQQQQQLEQQTQQLQQQLYNYKPNNSNNNTAYKAVKRLINSKANSQQLEQQWQYEQPRLAQAKQLDFTIAHAQNNYNRLSNSYSWSTTQATTKLSAD